MPYHVGEKGSYGCEGYPAVKDDGTVMGCHKTKEQAAKQIYAINVSEGNIESAKAMPTLTDEELDQVDKKAPCWKGYVQRGMKEKDGRMVPNCVPVKKDAITADMITKAEFTEGDFAMGVSDEEVYVGQVIHVMREGMLGIPGSEMSIEATPEDPAILIRIFEQDDEEGYWEETDKFVGFKANMATKIDPLMTEAEYYADEMSKAEGYVPPAGARAAARKAIKFKEEGKANGAGTSVGWTRAGQLARGETLSLSTVKRMYSYFSRHEVDKKGKDWGNEANPSNGYIMWLAWGGDAGYAWAKRIAQREADKALFADFGSDFTYNQSLTHIFKD